MSVPIQPVADYVVAVHEEAEAKTSSGLLLPGGAQEKPKVAKVVAVGPSVAGVKKGDKILYKSYSTTEVKLAREDYILVKEEDILATVK